MGDGFQLRLYRADDEAASIALWQRTWQLAYPSIDFAKRLDWWRARWRDEMVPVASIIVAERHGELIGFVTIDATGYLDQLVVGPEHWGVGLADALVDEAKRLSPGGRDAESQRRQFSRHPFLRTQRLCRRWRGFQPRLQPQGAADGVDAVTVVKIFPRHAEPANLTR